MSNRTPCSSQLIWCETQVEKLEQQLTEWKELTRNIDNQLRTELAAAQAREKVLHGWIEDRCRFDSLNMDLSNWRKFVEEYRAFPTDDTALKAAIQHGITEFLERTRKYVTNDASRKAALKAERERCRLHDAADVATKAMCKAWQLGQTYWQQADSDSYKQNAKSAITQDSFNDLLDSTAEAIRALEDE